MVYEMLPELKDCQRVIEERTIPAHAQCGVYRPGKVQGMYSTAELQLLGSHMDLADLEAVKRTVLPHDVMMMQYTFRNHSFSQRCDALPFQSGQQWFSHG
jgi:fatty-acyl-CoA synthase